MARGLICCRLRRKMTDLKGIKEQFKDVLWMPLFYLMIIGGLMVLLCFVVEYATHLKEPVAELDTAHLRVFAYCDDAVVCYGFRVQGHVKGGVSCFRDADLVEKYCGGGK